MISTSRNPSASIGAAADRPATPSQLFVGGSLFWEDDTFSLYLAGRGTASRAWANVAATGTATLVAGAASVVDARVTAASRILLERRTQGASPGHLGVQNVVAGGFDIISSDGADTGTVWYTITG